MTDTVWKGSYVRRRVVAGFGLKAAEVYGVNMSAHGTVYSTSPEYIDLMEKN
jgi:hypothetical protein